MSFDNNRELRNPCKLNNPGTTQFTTASCPLGEAPGGQTKQITTMRHAAPKRLGLYSLTFIVVSAALTAAGQNTLTNGIPSQDSLGSPTQAKSWKFTANAGDHVTLTMTKVSGGAAFNPRLEVISPAGYSQGAAAGNVGARLDLQAESGGIYTVLASDAFQAGAGSFQLQLAQIPEAFSVAASDEGGGLTNGASHLGTITAGDVDLWTTTAHAGDRITLQLSKTTGGATFTPQLELFGPDGTRLAQDSGSLASRVDIQAAADGTYTVQVSALTPDGAGNYQLQLVQTPGTLTVPSGDEGGPWPTLPTKMEQLPSETWTPGLSARASVTISHCNSPRSRAAPVLPRNSSSLAQMGPDAASAKGWPAQRSMLRSKARALMSPW